MMPIGADKGKQTQTRSPAAYDLTWLPTSKTTPEHSLPNIKGSFTWIWTENSLNFVSKMV